LQKKLKKFKCPACGDVNPLMELVNTMTCLSCNKANVEVVENGYVLIETEPLKILEISED